MLGWILLVTVCVIYFWAFVQVHICAGMSVVKATSWVVAEVLIVTVFLIVISEGVILDLLYPGWRAMA